MALPMCEQPPVRPTLTLVSSCPTPRHRPPAVARPPAAVFWFRRALVAAALLLFLWVSSLLAAKLQWSLSPEGPAAGLPQSEPAYVIVDDTALRVSPDGR
ncbi:MAG: hypothetical protein F4Y28_12910 [Acidimicrobiia bacterium]|nr:hypothetical protein [Acidimicrobiia bacterium]MYG59101.1 hypothetical protein [Acidimicrobiia bacterium]MYJ33235.1 hypothetical protein [Acidimicrobiia bacterium]